MTRRGARRQAGGVYQKRKLRPRRTVPYVHALRRAVVAGPCYPQQRQSAMHMPCHDAQMHNGSEQPQVRHACMHVWGGKHARPNSVQAQNATEYCARQPAVMKERKKRVKRKHSKLGQNRRRRRRCQPPGRMHPPTVPAAPTRWVHAARAVCMLCCLPHARRRPCWPCLLVACARAACSAWDPYIGPTAHPSRPWPVKHVGNKTRHRHTHTHTQAHSAQRHTKRIVAAHALGARVRNVM